MWSLQHIYYHTLRISSIRIYFLLSQHKEDDLSITVFVNPFNTINLHNVARYYRCKQLYSEHVHIFWYFSVICSYLSHFSNKIPIETWYKKIQDPDRAPHDLLFFNISFHLISFASQTSSSQLEATFMRPTSWSLPCFTSYMTSSVILI